MFIFLDCGGRVLWELQNIVILWHGLFDIDLVSAMKENLNYAVMSGDLRFHVCNKDLIYSYTGIIIMKL